MNSIYAFSMFNNQGRNLMKPCWANFEWRQNCLKTTSKALWKDQVTVFANRPLYITSACYILFCNRVRNFDFSDEVASSKAQFNRGAGEYFWVRGLRKSENFLLGVVVGVRGRAPKIFTNKPLNCKKAIFENQSTNYFRWNRLSNAWHHTLAEKWEEAAANQPFGLQRAISLLYHYAPTTCMLLCSTVVKLTAWPTFPLGQSCQMQLFITAFSDSTIYLKHTQ